MQAKKQEARLWNNLSDGSIVQKECAQIGQWNLVGAMLQYGNKKYLRIAVLSALFLFAVFMFIFPSWLAIILSLVLTLGVVYFIRLVKVYMLLREFKIAFIGDFKEEFVKTSMFPSMTEEEKILMFKYIDSKMQGKESLQKYNFFFMNSKMADEYSKILLNYDEMMCIFNSRRLGIL